MSRRKLAVLFGFTALSVILAGVATLISKPAEAALYQAGIERVNTNICSCPVRTGDCVCEWRN